MSAPQPPTPYPPQSAARQVGSFVSRVLWTAIPFGTLGLLGWVPALHIARLRRTPAAWWWLAGLAAGMVGECVLVALIPKGQDDASAGAGAFVITYMITATVYTWQGTRNELQAAMVPNPYAGYGTAWMPAPIMQTPAPAPAAMAPAPAPTPAPAAAASDMAAEIQAELRELRGFLGGEDAR